MSSASRLDPADVVDAAEANGGAPLSFETTSNHFGLCRRVMVSGMPLMLSGFNGEYDLDLSNANAPIYHRNNPAMFFGALPIKPSSVAFVNGHWEIQAPGFPPLRQVSHDKADAKLWGGDRVPVPSGVFEAPHGQAAAAAPQVKLVLQKPSLIARLAFPCPRPILRSYQEFTGLLGSEDLKFLRTERDERVPAVLFRCPRAQRRANFTILYSHGNGEDLFLNFHRTRALARAVGCDVLAYDYVGYSLSKLEGHCASEKGCLRSIAAAYGYLINDLGIPAAQIILYGRSIGSGPTVHLASRRECRDAVAGVVLECGILSAMRVVAGRAAVLVRPMDLFVNESKIHKVSRPVAVLHGRNDRVVPFTHGEGLHRLAQRPFDMLRVDAGHNNMPYRQCDEHTARFVDFLANERT